MQKNLTLLKETTISFLNAFEKGKAGWLFSFLVKLHCSTIEARNEACFWCYKPFFIEKVANSYMYCWYVFVLLEATRICKCNMDDCNNGVILLWVE